MNLKLFCYHAVLWQIVMLADQYTQLMETLLSERCKYSIHPLKGQLFLQTAGNKGSIANLLMLLLKNAFMSTMLALLLIFILMPTIPEAYLRKILLCSLKLVKGCGISFPRPRPKAFTLLSFKCWGILYTNRDYNLSLDILQLKLRGLNGKLPSKRPIFGLVFLPFRFHQSLPENDTTQRISAKCTFHSCQVKLMFGMFKSLAQFMKESGKPQGWFQVLRVVMWNHATSYTYRL